MSNFIIVPRSVFDRGAFGKDEPYTKREAFLDLVQMAAFEDSEYYVSGYKYHVGRGQLAVSKSFLVKRWGWSVDKVRRYLDYLKRNGWCNYACDHQCNQPITLISISCYDRYQGDDTTSATTAATTPATGCATICDTQDNNNNNNKKNNNKPSFAESVERIYALYPSSTKRSDGTHATLKSAKKNKAHIERMLSSGEYTEESLTYAIKRYLEETNTAYLKLFETFLNQVPDYSRSSPNHDSEHDAEPTREEAMHKALNPTEEERERMYRTRFLPQHPAMPGESSEDYWKRVGKMWDDEMKAWIGRRVDAVNNRY